MNRFLPLVCLFFATCVESLPPAPNSRKVEVRVESGMSTEEVARLLKQRGVIDSELEFRFLAWLDGSDGRIRPGRYRFLPGSPEKTVLRVLCRREPAFLMVTIPEGLTMNQTADILAAAEICPADDFLAACRDTGLMHELGIADSSSEGWLFPETYEFMTGTNPKEIVRRLVRQTRSVLNELRPRAPVRLSDREVVILASIVEREALVSSERPRIAGVFMNRLNRRLPLQSCATVEYILPEHKEQLTLDDLEIASPYNTYLHSGLPPGPICSPGRAALAAAFNPERHDYIFFVSRGDGTHVFSRNATEHDAAVRRRRSRS
ncbi:MAG: endolytic transglycosylase MltG [candidate division WOR-3 bacterium]